MSAQIVVGLGSNLGSREACLRAAVDLIADTRGCSVRALSSLFETEPVGCSGPLFLNAALNLQTDLSAEGLLERLLSIESSLGRQRPERWCPRTIDLDILWSELGSVSTPALTVPHPRLHERAFALAPLLEVAPELTPAYAPALQAAGGAPRSSGSLRGPRPPQEVDGEDRVRLELHARDLSDALAATATALAERLWGGAGRGPLEVVPFARECRPGDETEAFISALLEGSRPGFRPFRAVVCGLEPGVVQGRLVGCPGKGPPEALPEFSARQKRDRIELCVYPRRYGFDVVTFFNGITEG